MDQDLQASAFMLRDEPFDGLWSAFQSCISTASARFGDCANVTDLGDAIRVDFSTSPGKRPFSHVLFFPSPDGAVEWSGSDLLNPLSRWLHATVASISADLCATRLGRKVDPVTHAGRRLQQLFHSQFPHFADYLGAEGRELRTYGSLDPRSPLLVSMLEETGNKSEVKC